MNRRSFASKLLACAASLALAQGIALGAFKEKPQSRTEYSSIGTEVHYEVREGVQLTRQVRMVCNEVYIDDNPPIVSVSKTDTGWVPLFSLVPLLPL